MILLDWTPSALSPQDLVLQQKQEASWASRVMAGRVLTLQTGAQMS